MSCSSIRRRSLSLLAGGLLAVGLVSAAVIAPAAQAVPNYCDPEQLERRDEPDEHCPLSTEPAGPPDVVQLSTRPEPDEDEPDLCELLPPSWRRMHYDEEFCQPELPLYPGQV